MRFFSTRSNRNAATTANDSSLLPTSASTTGSVPIVSKLSGSNGDDAVAIVGSNKNSRHQRNKIHKSKAKKKMIPLLVENGSNTSSNTSSCQVSATSCNANTSSASSSSSASSCSSSSLLLSLSAPVSSTKLLLQSDNQEQHQNSSTVISQANRPIPATSNIKPRRKKAFRFWKGRSMDTTLASSQGTLGNVPNLRQQLEDQFLMATIPPISISPEDLTACIAALTHLFTLTSSAMPNSSEISNEEQIALIRTMVMQADQGKLVPTLLAVIERCNHIIEMDSQKTEVNDGSNESSKNDTSALTPVATTPNTSSSTYSRVQQARCLALLTLNHLSIPEANKQMMALDCHGAAILGRFLAADPSCHLYAIVLVNLTFASPNLRLTLVTANNGIDIVESLVCALRVSSFTKQEYDIYQQLLKQTNVLRSPTEQLYFLMSEEWRLQLSMIPTIEAAGDGFSLPSPSKRMFPETSCWCLTAIKNLTRPIHGDYEAMAAQSLVRTGAIPHILHYIETDTFVQSSYNNMQNYHNHHFRPPPPTNDSSRKSSNMSAHTVLIQRSTTPSSITGASSENADSMEQPPSHEVQVNDDDDVQETSSQFQNSRNDLSTWSSTSASDAALFVILNLAAEPAMREYLLCDINTVSVLSAITAWNFSPLLTSVSTSEQQIALRTGQFQCLKARMALAYLLGAEGGYFRPTIVSKPAIPSTSSESDPPLHGIHPNDDEPEVSNHVETVVTGMMEATGIEATKDGLGADSVIEVGGPIMTDTSLLLLPEHEAAQLIGLLACTMHQRDGPNYSATTFGIKQVLYAIRCLICNDKNHFLLASKFGLPLNLLLVKVLAIVSFPLSSPIDQMTGNKSRDESSNPIQVFTMSHLFDSEAAEHACYSLYLLSSYCFTKVSDVVFDAISVSAPLSSLTLL
jgi:hypothetical protein